MVKYTITFTPEDWRGVLLKKRTSKNGVSARKPRQRRCLRKSYSCYATSVRKPSETPDHPLYPKIREF